MHYSDKCHIQLDPVSTDDAHVPVTHIDEEKTTDFMSDYAVLNYISE